MNEISFDDQHWPLVRVKCPAIFDKQAADALVQRWLGWLERKERFALVIDGSTVSSMEALARKVVSTFISENTPALKQYCAGDATVVRSALTRGIVSAIAWIAPYPFPVKLFEHERDAVAWASTTVNAR